MIGALLQGIEVLTAKCSESSYCCEYDTTKDIEKLLSGSREISLTLNTSEQKHILFCVVKSISGTLWSGLELGCFQQQGENEKTSSSCKYWMPSLGAYCRIDKMRELYNVFTWLKKDYREWRQYKQTEYIPRP